ncbi:50S ribosomal protein L15 [Propionicicella superfundia]|uniref:50S ribosomal protein L15 n=1 Tax=Propionicicella superfundia TaxID=348582 RepID=UPI00042880E0|nr:50S ribosomal protein L15 [Propionicicella superfundia]
MALKLHDLRPAPGAKTAKTRVGRGEGSKGKTAGRGTKGTGARKNTPENFEGGQMPLHMRMPKLRGFKNPFRVEFQPVNLGKIAELFPGGGKVTVADLVAKGAVRKDSLVKVLGGGEVSAAYDIDAHAYSASAKAKIEAAGGTANEL